MTDTGSYIAYGNRLYSSDPFIHHLIQDARKPDLFLTIYEEQGNFFLPTETPYYTSPFSDNTGAPRFLIWRSEVESVIHSALHGDYRLTQDRITARVKGPIDRLLVEEFILGTIFALRLEWDNFLALHAAGLVVDGRAIGLMANSGSGKSTLAAFLLANGARFLTDDILPVKTVDNKPMAWPGYAELGAWPASADFLPSSWPRRAIKSSDKIRLSLPSEICDIVARPLSALFILERGGDQGRITCSRLNMAEATYKLAQYSYAAPILERTSESAGRLQRLARLAKVLPIYILQYPSGFDHLEEAAKTILAITKG